MTNDNLQTRRHYARLYWNWPASLIQAHLQSIDIKVDEMHPDEMIEARALMDYKLPIWK